MSAKLGTRLAKAKSGRRSALWLLALFGCGCAGSASAAADAKTGAARDTRLTHEPCDLSAAGAERLDANGDKRPDVTLVKAGQRESCRALDLNFDGAIDVWVYFDAHGSVRRRESDYDRDGKLDEIALFAQGVLSEKQQATAPAGRVDTWRYYSGGKLKRAERDSNGDAVIDEWWEYPKPHCALVHADINGDGRPDPGATIDQCAAAAEEEADAKGVAAAPAAPAAPSTNTGSVDGKAPAPTTRTPRKAPPNPKKPAATAKSSGTTANAGLPAAKTLPKLQTPAGSTPAAPAEGEKP